MQKSLADCKRVSTHDTSGYSNIHSEHTRSSSGKRLHHCGARELDNVAMVTLTAATASSKPRDPQLIIRVKTPSRHTLKDKKTSSVEIQLSNNTCIPQFQQTHSQWWVGQKYLSWCTFIYISVIIYSSLQCSDCSVNSTKNSYNVHFILNHISSFSSFIWNKFKSNNCIEFLKFKSCPHNPSRSLLATMSSPLSWVGLDAS